MTRVKLSDVVRRANTKEDKDNTELEFYVGGEHIESNEVLIKDRGIIKGSTIGPMFYFGFKAGQVLLVSRNPHLRKAGMVTFDGICSEKTFVLETIDNNVLLQEYLPFVLQSDDFWMFAEANKSGSVNFFLNWSTLAKYEFDLPDIETQRKLAKVLWAMNDTKEAYKNLLTKTDEMVKARFVEMFGDPVSNVKGLKVVTLKDICVGKLSYGSGAAATDYDGTTRYIRITDITDTGELNNDVKSPNTIDEKYLLSDGDVLFARSGNTVGKTFRYKAEYGRAIYAGFLIRLIPDTAKVLPDYVFGFTRSPFYEEFVKKTQRTVGQPNINAQEYGDLQICLPTLEEQKRFAEFMKQSDKSKFAIQQSIKDITDMMHALINKSFAPEGGTK